jgi:hypothetical protein
VFDGRCMMPKTDEVANTITIPIRSISLNTEVAS